MRNQIVALVIETTDEKTTKRIADLLAQTHAYGNGGLYCLPRQFDTIMVFNNKYFNQIEQLLSQLVSVASRTVEHPFSVSTIEYDNIFALADWLTHQHQLTTEQATKVFYALRLRLKI